jgi:predicted ABC-type exoprotein transport system permease subunit
VIHSGGISLHLVRGLALIAAGAISLFNGKLLPFFDSVDYLLGIATRGYPFLTRALLYNYVTPLAIAAMTLLVAGIPAALYERIRGLRASTPMSLGIWLLATVLLSLPTLMRMVSED